MSGNPGPGLRAPRAVSPTPGAPSAGPYKASAAWGAAARSAAKARSAGRSTASIRATVSSTPGTLSQIETSRASRSARLEGLSSPISSPAFICARARATSSSVTSSATRRSSSTVSSASGRASAAPVPA